MSNFEALRRWAEVDRKDEEGLKNLLDAQLAADAYIRGAGVPDSDSPLRDLLERKMALYYFECRAPDPRYGYPDLPPDLHALVNSLRYAPAECAQGGDES